MSGQALYRRWRPQTYADVRGQEHVTKTLRNALVSGRIGHAYLFAGPRGTGKTSVARILAKAVNCQAEPDQRPCDKCTMCQAIREGRLLDLIEIDAASNRGIDEVRDLREKIGFVPTEARYKVYILDEAHMLTGPAFNALLKTLEEPPAHVIFILVTTDPHKIAATILSRCQRFDFRRLTKDEMVAQLSEIASNESLDVEPAALEAMARHATGSLRDAISLLDQMRSYGRDTITVQQLRESLGHAADEDIQALVGHIQSGDVPAGLTLINDLVDRGVDVHFMLQQILDFLRELLVMQVSGGDVDTERTTEMANQMRSQASAMGKDRLLQTIRTIMNATEGLRAGTQAHLPLELALIEAAMSNGQEPGPALEQTRSVARPAPVRRTEAPVQTAGQAAAPRAASPPARIKRRTPTAGEAVATNAALREAPSETEAPATTQQAPVSEAATGAAMEDPTALVELRGRWSDILSEVRKQSLKAEAALRSGCRPVAVEGNLVTLIFRDSFIMGLIEDEEQLGAVEAAMGSALGRPLRLRCILEQDWATIRGRSSDQADQASQPAPGIGEKSADSAGATSEPVSEEEAMDPVVKEAISKYGATLVGKSSGR